MEALLELKALLEPEIPPLPPINDVTRVLEKFSKAVSEGEPPVRQEVIEAGAYDMIIKTWTIFCDTGEVAVKDFSLQAQKVRECTLQALYSITVGNPDIVCAKGLVMIKQAFDTRMADEIKILGMKTMRNICTKSEENRDILASFMDIIPMLIMILRKDPPCPIYIRQWCSCIKSLFLADDKRVAYNRSGERKRILYESQGLSLLTHYLNHFKDGPAATLNAIIIVLGSMACRDDYCISIFGNGTILHTLYNIYDNMHSNMMLTQNALSLLRYLCMSPTIRKKVCGYEIMEPVLKVVYLHAKSSETMETALSCCAFMTLRSPCHVAQFLDSGGIEKLMTTISNHMDSAPVLKAACFVLRNVAVHGHQGGREAILKADGENILELIQNKYPELKYNYVKPVIRDLGLSVSPTLPPESTSADLISPVANLPDVDQEPREPPGWIQPGCRDNRL